MPYKVGIQCKIGICVRNIPLYARNVAGGPMAWPAPNHVLEHQL